jgi:lysophospholipase L1-like esterase
MVPSARRRSWMCVATLIAAGLFGGSAHGRAAEAPTRAPAWPARTWAGSWSTTPLPGTTGFTDRTLREIVHLGMGGDQIRIRLTNAFGTDGVAVDGVTAGLRGAGAALVTGTLRAVTFGGSRDVIVAAGADVLSDPVALPVAAGQDVAVSLYVHGTADAVTRHGGAYTTSFSAAGDHAGDAGGEAFTSTMTSWSLLDGIDVRTASPARAVVALGDSLTDGTASTVDANRRYTDDLARRIGGRGLSVLNQGASGNRLLTDAGGSGVSAQARFDRDVVAQTGVRTVILLEGINDIGHDQGPVSGNPVTVADLIAGLTNIVQRAHAHGLRIIGGTLTPVGGSKYDSPAAEAKRQAVNAWIRTGGAFDGVADFDAAVRDPLDPARFLPAYDSGDHLHPDDAGYQAMADAVDLRRL